MKLLTRDTDYAVRALLAMAGKKSIVSVADLVAALKIPGPFLRRILQRLARRGWWSRRKAWEAGSCLNVTLPISG